jgi:hypothetical protein
VSLIDLGRRGALQDHPMLADMAKCFDRHQLYQRMIALITTISTTIGFTPINLITIDA